MREGVGRLARIGCSRAAAPLNPMLLYFAFSVLESEPPTSKLGGSGIFCERPRKKTVAMLLAFVPALRLGSACYKCMDRGGYYSARRSKNMRAQEGSTSGS